MKHFLSPADLSLDETRALFERARGLRNHRCQPLLAGKALGIIFFNQSLRTRATFDLGMQQLGGHAVVLDVGSGTWRLEWREGVPMDGEYAEHIKEATRVLSRYVDILAVRAFAQRQTWELDREDAIVRGFARYATVPVINAESSLYHPCQSLADLMTIEDRLGSATRQPIAITWAYHPKAVPMAVPNSILLEAAKFGMDIRLAHPPGWELDPDVMAQARTMTTNAGGSLTLHHDMESAMKGARVVYAKSWGAISTYNDPDRESATKAPWRDAWRVTMRRMDATDNGFFMHCLPVRRGVIVDDAVLDSDRNAAIDEAENRLHVQKALLARMLGA